MKPLNPYERRVLLALLDHVEESSWEPHLESILPGAGQRNCFIKDYCEWAMALVGKDWERVAKDCDLEQGKFLFITRLGLLDYFRSRLRESS